MGIFHGCKSMMLGGFKHLGCFEKPYNFEMIGWDDEQDAYFLGLKPTVLHQTNGMETEWMNSLVE